MLFTTKFSYAGSTVYLRVYIPSGRGIKGCPKILSPNDADVNILKSLGVKGRITIPNDGTFISIVGAVTIGGLVGYVDASATPNVNVLYVGTTIISRFKAGIISLNKYARGSEI
jgi:hypothetical protein